MENSEKIERSGPLTPADLQLLGYNNIRGAEGQLQKSGLPSVDRCRIFSAHARAGIGESVHAFAYFLANAREQDMRTLGGMLVDNKFGEALGASNTYVVIPNSISGKPILKLLGQQVPVVYEDLMWGTIQSEVSEYMDSFQRRMKSLQEGVFYVEPSFENSDSNEPTARLREFLSGKSDEGDGVIVVRGNAGLGKSTLVAKVAHELSQNWQQLRVVPVLLGGQTTWRKLVEHSREQHITNLWDIVSLALEQDLLGRENVGALLKREDLFKRILMQGYAALIFDGFDELPKVGGAATTPADNFQWLSGVATHSSARIVVTTRPAFWDREMRAEIGRDHQVLNLVPFSKENAYDYFDLFFDGDPGKENKVKCAKEMYVGLNDNVHPRTGSEFINLPACVRMIAEYVKKGGSIPAQGGEQQPVIRGILMQILRRERIRQRINVSADALYKAFEEIAAVYGTFTLTDLACALSEDISESEMAKMEDHAFIKKVSGDSMGKTFEFKEDFLAHYMKASYIFRLLMDSVDTPAIIAKCREGDRGVSELIDAESDGVGQLTDRLADMLDMEDLDFLAQTHKLCGKDVRLFHLKSFLFHVIAKTVVLRKQDASRKERADEVLFLLHGDKEEKRVSNICVMGTVSGISVDGWKIADSRFHNLNLTKHQRNALYFVQCQFKGSLELGGAQCEFSECKADEQAKLVISRHSAMKITDEDLQDYMKIALGRFWHQTVRTISQDEWSTGRTTGIESRFDLLELMTRFGFVKIKGHRRRFLEVQSIGELREFMENGDLQGSVQEIFDAMKEKVR